jgi:opacity protein-like surface antigen
MAAIAAAVLALALGVGNAHALGVEVGAFGGMSFPVVQEDVAQGSIFGVRVPVKLIPLITVEPFYSSSMLGDKTQDFAGLSYTSDGGQMTSFGANVMLTTGGPVSFYPLVGITSQKYTRSGSSDINESGWNFGLGLGFAPMPMFNVHIRGELNMLTTGDTSRKFANATIGLNYKLPFGGK